MYGFSTSGKNERKGNHCYASGSVILLKKLQSARSVFVRIRRLWPWLALSAAGLLAAAGVGLYAMLYQPAQPTSRSLEIVPSDSFNLLFTLTDPDSGAPLLFALIGLDAPDKRLTVMPLPGALAVHGGTLADQFNESGPTQASAACAETLGVPVDFHWAQDSASFAQVVDLNSGVDCTLPAAVDTRVPHGAQVQADSGFQHLNGMKVEAAACYASYTDPADKLAAQGAVLQALLRETCNGQDLAPDSFGSQFDQAKTNFSMNDLLSKTRALEQVTSAGGRVDVLLPASGRVGAPSLSAADKKQAVQAFGRQNRRYAP